MKVISRLARVKRTASTMLAFGLFSLALTPAYASDTEVYLRTLGGESSPTLMMFLDSSSVMLKCMTNTNDCSADYDNSRIAALRSSIQAVLLGNPKLPKDAGGNTDYKALAAITKPAPGYVKLGYSRNNPSSNDGGWVRFPATKLDDPSPMFTGRISIPTRDYLPAFVGDTNPPDWDDATGTDAGATTLQIGKSTAAIRLRFRNVTIPLNAKVISARIVFTNSQASVPSAPAIDVDMGLESNAPSLQSLTDINNSLVAASNWGSATTGASAARAVGVTVTPTGSGSRTGRADITTILNNFVQSGFQSGWDWCGGNNIAVRVKPSSGSGGASNNNWTVYAADGDATEDQKLRPRLEVVYSLAPGDQATSCSKPQMTTVAVVKNDLDDIEWYEGSTQADSDDDTLEPGLLVGASLSTKNYVGVRFQNVGVPQGARIVSAYLYATGACNRTVCTPPDLRANTATLTVPNPATLPITLEAFDTDDLPAFCTNSLDCVPPTASRLSPITWNTVLQDTVKDYNHAVDVTSFVNSIIQRSGWVSGNALGFRLSNTTGTNYPNAALTSVRKGAASAMYLMITYQSPTRITNLTGKMTARQGLAGDVEAFLWAQGGTPIGDAYGETARYILGMTPLYDTTVTTDLGGNLTSATYKVPDDTTVVTVSGVKTYKTPAPSSSTECSASAGIFAMTGGENANASNATQHADLITSGYNPGASTIAVNSTSNDKANFQAMIAVANHLASGRNQLSNKLRTDVVLFRSAGQSLDTPLVKDLTLAAEGTKSNSNGGKFYEATNQSQLTAALEESLKKVIDTNGSITAPGVAVNQFNRLSHLDQLYYAVFDPPNPPTSRWTGNVKRYRLKFIDTAVSSTAIIADVTDINAVDGLTGFFLSTAQSFWSASVDGASVKSGGAASKLPAPGSRKIFSNLSAADDLTLVELASADAVKARANFGVTTDNQVTNLRNWLLGWKIYIGDPGTGDVSTTAISTTGAEVRNEMGGVLHSQPVLVNYGYLSGSNLNDASTDPATSTNPNYNANYQDNTVFFSTMEGMLHALDAKTGVEQFAFMPRYVLPAVKDMAMEKLLANASDLPAFGMDLTWTPWRVDGDGNLKIETTTTSDRLWLFGGMRMGGRNYYALDVKNRAAPLLKWRIQGGIDADFLGLGQTWSQPVLANVKIGSTVTPVLFVGGGYDMKHEGTGYSNTADPTGGWFYIINAVTGAKIFSASGTTNAGTPDLSVSTMKWGVTGSPKLLDTDQDGLADAAYFGDLAGQVFRVDINNVSSTGNSNIVKRITRIANLGQFSNSPTTETVGDQRRFYESPSVAIMKDTSGLSYVAVALGSGNRSHPLNNSTTDRFYVLKDVDVLRKDLLTTTTLNTGTITPADLGTVNPTSAAGATLTDKKGWQIGFVNSGEKVMSKAIILLGEVFFTTYTPDTSVTAACSAAPGESRLYRMSAVDGAASYDLNKDGTITADDRSVGGRRGLVGEPQPFVDASGKNAILTGTGVERNRDLQTPGLRRTRWYQMEKK